MISSADLNNLSKAIVDLYSPDLHVENYVELAFRFVHAVLPADQVNYGSLDRKSGTLDAATSAHTTNWEEAVAGFGRCMAKYPYFSFDPTVNGGRPFFRNDFLSLRQFRGLDIFSECFRILDMQNHAAVHVPTDDGKLLWFGIERAGSGDYTERDRQVLTLAQEHLSNAHRLAHARQKIRNELKLEARAFCQAGFTPREAEVASWLTEGKTNVEIAALLRIGVPTVKGHVTALFNKTGASNRLALTLQLIDLAQQINKARMHRVPAPRCH